MSGRDVVTVDFSEKDQDKFAHDLTATALRVFLGELDDLGREIVENLLGRKTVKWTKKGGESTRVFKAAYSYTTATGKQVEVAGHWGYGYTDKTYTSDRRFTEWPVSHKFDRNSRAAHSRDLWKWRVDIIDGEQVALHVTNPAPYVKYIRAKNLHGKSPLVVLVRSPLKRGAKKIGKRAQNLLEG